MLPNTATQSLVVPGATLDPGRVYYLEIPELRLRALVRRDPLFRQMYSPKALGAVVSDDGSKTGFRVFAPRAEAVQDYWRGLLTLRNSDYGSVFWVAEVPDGHYRWITPADSTLLGYVVGGRVLVLANGGTREGVFTVDLPAGRWRQVGARERVDLKGVGGEYARLRAGTQTVRVPAGSFLIWVADGTGP